MRLPKLRLPIWLPLPSLCLWALTVLAGCLVCCLPVGLLRKRLGGPLPLTPLRLGRFLLRLATRLLWSGSFTLCDVNIPNQGVRVKIRML